MYETLDAWASLSPDWDTVVTPLRSILPPYTHGLCAIALVLVAHRQLREALRAAELGRAYAAARMAMLSAQLQPHFPFNSLHAISVLIEDSPRQATAMLARLGDFLRHALESSRWPWIDLATELAGLEAYLAVQQALRRPSEHCDRRRPRVARELRAFTLLQPLAENAIEHGRKGEPTLRVRVAARVSGERLYIVVTNSSPRLAQNLTPTSYGHGLSNVELRLKAAYGADAHLTVGPDSAGGTSAVLDLPLRRVASRIPAERAAA
jgi:two-component system, LytTR family, sensor kinase